MIEPFQRDESNDLAGDLGRVPSLARQLDDARDQLARLTVLGVLADLLRSVGEMDGAIEAAHAAVALARDLDDDRREAANTVRLATALQYAGRHREALVEFDAASERTSDGFAQYRHFLLQHRGKCLVEMGRLDEARASFESALELRRELADPTLVDSTQQALVGLETRRVTP